MNKDVILVLVLDFILVIVTFVGAVYMLYLFLYTLDNCWDKKALIDAATYLVLGIMGAVHCVVWQYIILKEIIDIKKESGKNE